MVAGVVSQRKPRYKALLRELRAQSDVAETCPQGWSIALGLKLQGPSRALDPDAAGPGAAAHR